MGPGIKVDPSKTKDLIEAENEEAVGRRVSATQLFFQRPPARLRAEVRDRRNRQ